jgi:hypothetical protein
LLRQEAVRSSSTALINGKRFVVVTSMVKRHEFRVSRNTGITTREENERGGRKEETRTCEL